MQRDGSRPVAGTVARELGASWLSRTSRLAAAGRPLLGLTLCVAAAGCGSIGSALSPLAQHRDINVAVESIDGPPRDVSQKLVSALNAEGEPLRVGFVPAASEAAFHIRGYLAVHADRSATSVAWAWDVYDADLNRAFRLSGEEPAGSPAAGKSWAVADDALLRRVARAGLDQLAGFMANPPAAVAPTPAPAPPRKESDTVASRDSAPTTRVAEAAEGH